MEIPRPEAAMHAVMKIGIIFVGRMGVMFLMLAAEPPK